MTLPYDHEYPVYLTIGLVADREESVNPRRDSTYTQETWEQLTEAEKLQWLWEYTKDWAAEYIAYGLITPEVQVMLAKG